MPPICKLLQNISKLHARFYIELKRDVQWLFCVVASSSGAYARRSFVNNLEHGRYGVGKIRANEEIGASAIALYTFVMRVFLL